MPAGVGSFPPGDLSQRGWQEITLNPSLYAAGGWGKFRRGRINRQFLTIRGRDNTP